MSSRFSQLQSLGLTNNESDDYGTLASASPRKPPTSWCTSYNCCTYSKLVKYRNTFVERNVRRVEMRKVVPKGTSNCPDCGFALIWKVES